MAGVAGDLLMGSGQCECGLGIVVEEPRAPIDRVVAMRAVISEAPFVRVVLGVTCIALGRRIDIDMRLVTRTALGVGVPAEQRERGQVVVEEEIL